MALPIRNQSEIYDSEKNVAKVMGSFLRVKQPLYRIDGLTLHYDDPVLVGIGKKQNKTNAQVALAWGISQGHSVLPKSETPSRIQANLAGDFKLDAEDMKKI
ncbi:uncharacterized protein K444DRAFT_633397 [Hyaloscypha bicolor E]|jgi:alcohol dehydrogenase (NADP+)|uniref:NADP-dependent oxidoreductase domain-containing protein n=1 Tax=Hyaloscypha bicolor E TaxID=1095630 RepID=A0A2J6SYM4_9HELO|nr:uncharacterized protein K444DRAFT_633397 [Hyaloscypha bicolor E]PMD55871.1 hypothetical protein K444DRAFT_633397 [Hyaloscypha bicolor E]